MLRIVLAIFISCFPILTTFYLLAGYWRRIRIARRRQVFWPPMLFRRKVYVGIVAYLAFTCLLYVTLLFWGSYPDALYIPAFCIALGISFGTKMFCGFDLCEPIDSIIAFGASYLLMLPLYHVLAYSADIILSDLAK